jgi:hypothetical protein
LLGGWGRCGRQQAAELLPGFRPGGNWPKSNLTTTGWPHLKRVRHDDAALAHRGDKGLVDLGGGGGGGGGGGERDEEDVGWCAAGTKVGFVPRQPRRPLPAEAARFARAPCRWARAPPTRRRRCSKPAPPPAPPWPWSGTSSCCLAGGPCCFGGWRGLRACWWGGGTDGGRERGRGTNMMMVGLLMVGDDGEEWNSECGCEVGVQNR